MTLFIKKHLARVALYVLWTLFVRVWQNGEAGQQWEKHRNGVKLDGNEVTTCEMGVIICFVDI